MKKGNNKGFSLIEIIIGIGMLAVIIVPILHTFITSAQINRDSRQVMIQTEVAQTIMEGFAGKSYAEVKASAAALATSGSGIVSGNLALSSIDGNLFNNTDETICGAIYTSHGIGWNSPENHLYGQLTSVQKNSLEWKGNTIDPICDNVSDNALMASMNQVFGSDAAIFFQLAKVDYSHLSDITEARQFTYWVTPQVPGSPGGDALFLVYGNIHYEGYRFDAVVSFLPMARSEDDLYYTYRILLSLYESQPDIWYGNRFENLLMVMDGGIMAGQ